VIKGVVMVKVKVEAVVLLVAVAVAIKSEWSNLGGLEKKGRGFVGGRRREREKEREREKKKTVGFDGRERTVGF
jgi:hypothetical protein